MESCDLLQSPGPLADPVKLAYGSYLVELVELLTVEAEPVDGVYDLLGDALDELRIGAATGGLLRSYELRLLHHTGFHPQLDACAQCRKQLGNEESLFLDPTHGRLLCPACRQPGHDVVSLHGATLTALQRLKELSLTEARAYSLDEVVATEAAELLGRLLALHLPRPPRSARLITTLAP
jgi:DNA repair protein RecO (recombination protein O)